MRRVSSLLGLLPLLGLGELAAHRYFATRAPEPSAYEALGRELSKTKRPGVPVVVAPPWAEPLVRAAAPNAFPIGELTRPDDSGFSELLEVSLLGASAAPPGFVREAPRRVGPFSLSVLKSSRPEQTSFDFVTAVDVDQVEVFLEHGGARTPCPKVTDAPGEAGGLHGHSFYPGRRFRCSAERFVAVSIVEDAEYRPHRCILTRLPQTGRVVLRFNGVPQTSRLVGWGGFAWFLERDASSPQVELSLTTSAPAAHRRRFAGGEGWERWEVAGTSGGVVEAAVERLAPSQSDFCFALEAR
jgi:hypothetical protein